MIDLRSLLSKARIDWKDRGSNCSANFVNIACPLCGNDPSYHLRIHETDGWWYCLRNSAHKGRTLRFIFGKLGIAAPEGQLGTGARVEQTPKILNLPEFDKFEDAYTEEALYYLWDRKFMYPPETVKKFNLKVAKSGRWAGRLIVPLTVGWTGRTMRKNDMPRYLSETNESGFFRYGRGASGVLVEGPIDALKVATVSNDMWVVAMTGGRLSPALLQFIRTLSGTLYYTPDATVGPAQRMDAIRVLRLACPALTVKNTYLPEGVKDPGEFTENEARQWLYTLSS